MRMLVAVFRALFRTSDARAHALENLEPDLLLNPWVARLVDFLSAPSRLGVVASRRPLGAARSGALQR
jgi:hypothetical protein